MLAPDRGQVAQAAEGQDARRLQGGAFVSFANMGCRHDLRLRDRAPESRRRVPRSPVT